MPAKEREEEVAAGAICPMPDCGVLVIAFRASSVARIGHREPWELACGRCGIEFVVPEGELVFRSIPKKWLMAGVQVA